MSSDSSPRPLVAPRFLPLLGLGGALLAIAGGIWLGLPGGLLTAAALVLLLVIVLVWQSLQYLSGDTELSFEEALSLAAPTAEEEQKRSVLRALKDLDYERSVGKISEADFRELSSRYRAEAKRLIVAVDSTLQERREKAEALLEARLKSAAAASEPEADPSRRRKKKKRLAASPTSGGEPSAEDEASTQDAPSTEGAPPRELSGGEKVP